MAKKYVKVVDNASGEVLLESARWCDSWLCKLIGLQFRRHLGSGEGLILVHGKDSVQATSIHMFFVYFPIAAIWIDASGRVTSVQKALPWRPYYASPKPARYVLETSPEFVDRISVDDVLSFVPG